MKILAPSYKRATTCKTHLQIPEVTYCVHEFEAMEYEDQGHEILLIPDKYRGNLSKVRNYLKNEHLGEFGYLVDDDIEGFNKWNYRDNRFQLDRLNPHEVMEQLEHMKMMAEQLGVPLVGMNVISDKGSYREYTPFSFTNYISASLMGIFKNPFDFDERIPLKEDYDYCLQLLNNYRRILRFNMVSMVKKDHKNIGGCADVRTASFEKAQMEAFQKKWGKKIVRTDPHNPNDINPILKVPINGI